MSFDKTDREEAPTSVVISSVFMCNGDDGKGDKSREAISDSGTNINVMSRQAAEKLQDRIGVEREDREGKQFIRFGKEGAKEKILYYIKQKGMMDEVAVVENVAATLLHNRNFTDRGCTVVYDEGSVYAIRKGRIIVEGVYDDRSRLYYWDLDNLYDPWDTYEETTNRREAVNRVELASAMRASISRNGDRRTRERRKDRGSRDEMGPSINRSTGESTLNSGQQADRWGTKETQAGGQGEQQDEETQAGDGGEQQDEETQAGDGGEQRDEGTQTGIGATGSKRARGPYRVRRSKTRITAVARRKAMHIHRQYKHIPYTTLANNKRSGALVCDDDVTAEVFDDLARRKECIQCAVTRWNQPRRGGEEVTRRYPVGHTFALDYQGPINPPSMGMTGFVLIEDLGSGYYEVYGVKSKKQVTNCVRRWMSTMMSYGHRPTEARHDSGSVEIGTAFERAIKTMGVRPIQAPEHIPEKRVERLAQTVINYIQTGIMVTPTYSAKDWLAAASGMADIRSMLTTEASEQHGAGVTPFELVTGRKPSTEDVERATWGDVVVVSTPKKMRVSNKMGTARNQPGRVMKLGLDETRGAKVQVFGGNRVAKRGNMQRVNMDCLDPKSPADIREVEVTHQRVNGEEQTNIRSNRNIKASIEELLQLQEEASDRDVERGDEMVRKIIEQSGDVNRGASGNNQTEAETEDRNAEHMEEEREEEEEEEDERDDASKYIYPRGRSGHLMGEYWHAMLQRGVNPEPDVVKQAYMISEMFDGIRIDEDSASDSSTQQGEQRMQLAWNAMDDAKTWDTGGASTSSEPSEGSESSTDSGPPASSKQSKSSGPTARGSGSARRGGSQGGKAGDKRRGHARFWGGTAPAARKGKAQVVLRAMKARVARGEENPNLRMVEESEELRSTWHEAMSGEFQGMRSRILTPCTDEYARGKDVTRHVTTFTRRRVGSVRKVRINIDGREEIRRGVFPDRGKLYAPAMDGELLKILVQRCAHYDLRMTKSDAVQCFLNNNMEDAENRREIIIHLSEYECGVPGGSYYVVDAVSYGCADASREWYERIRAAMEEMGYTVSVYHPCLYIKRTQGNGLVIAGIATDDMFQGSSKNESGRRELEELRVGLDSRHQWKHFDEPGDVLGAEIEARDNGTVTMRQRAEIEKIKAVFYPEGAPVTLTPADVGATSDDMEESVNVTTYKSKLGTLSYARMTRHDILPSLSKRSVVAMRPTKRDMEALHWLAAYLVTTGDVGLVYDRGPVGTTTNDPIEWTGSSDAAWHWHDDGSSQLAVLMHAGTRAGRASNERWQAANYANSSKEKGPCSADVSTAELKALMKLTAYNQIIRGINEEITGVADRDTVEAVPSGSARATTVSVSGG